MTSYVSANLREAMYGQQTDDVLILLITIDHPNLAEPIRISTDPTERHSESATQIVYKTVSNGENFIFFPIRVKLPDDTEDGPRSLELEWDNIHKQYVETIRELTSPPTVQVDIVLASDPDTIELSWPEFFMRNIKYDSSVIRCTLDMETLETEPYPGGSFVPSYFPGLF